MNAESPAIREATSADLPALAELERLCFVPPWSLDAIRSSLAEPGGLVLVAERTGRVVGSAVFLRVAGESELLRVAVRPDDRRRRIADSLVRSGLERLPGVCHLEVRAGAVGARALYRTLGFREVGTRPRYYDGREDAILYSRPAGPG